jgi:hypothetical protein
VTLEKGLKETCQTCNRVQNCKTYNRRGEEKCAFYTPNAYFTGRDNR